MLKPKKPNLEAKYDVPSLDYQVKDILHNFNFEQVLKVMETPCQAVFDEDGKVIEYQIWKLYNKGSFRLPSVEELKQLAADLLWHMVDLVKKSKEEYHIIGTGPFKVTYRWGVIELDFVLTSWSWD